MVNITDEKRQKLIYKIQFYLKYIVLFITFSLLNKSELEWHGFFHWFEIKWNITIYFKMIGFYLLLLTITVIKFFLWFMGIVAFDHARHLDIVAFIRDGGIDVWRTDIVALMCGAQILWHWSTMAHRYCGIDVWRTDIVASMCCTQRLWQAPGICCPVWILDSVFWGIIFLGNGWCIF